MDNGCIGCDRGVLNYRRYLAGDEEGLTDIIREYGDRLYRYIRGFVHDDDVAEDLLSETFLKLILRQNVFREESSLKTYLYAIARYEALSWLRRHRRKREVSLEEAGDLCGSDLPETLLQQTERHRQLYAAMSQLHGAYREVLQLVYLEELSCEEAAAVMHTSRKQTANLLYRGRKALRTILEKEGFEYEDL